MHEACFNEKGTHRDCPQGLESDSRFCSANPVTNSLHGDHVKTMEQAVRILRTEHFHQFRVTARQTWIWIQALRFSSQATLSKSVDISAPQF